MIPLINFRKCCMQVWNSIIFLNKFFFYDLLLQIIESISPKASVEKFQPSGLFFFINIKSIIFFYKYIYVRLCLTHNLDHTTHRACSSSLGILFI